LFQQSPRILPRKITDGHELKKANKETRRIANGREYIVEEP